MSGYTGAFVVTMLQRHRHPEHGYRGCLGLLSLAKRYGPERLEAACAKVGQKLRLRRQEGYDHSYFFVSTFMESHLSWHAERLR